ncbi:MAG: hypothetical protein JWO80_2485 [Bryobacterales bacterium]|nr:hypothetical protein [Bryobacterales bacterium]
MNKGLCLLAFALASPVAAQFVDAVRNNQAKPGYVNGYSNWKEDQVVLAPIVNPVAAPSSPKPTFGLLSPYSVPPPPKDLAAGLPDRAREALETAATADGGVTATTDANGVTRFATTVYAPPRFSAESRPHELHLSPLNEALIKSLNVLGGFDLPAKSEVRIPGRK